MPVPWRRIKPGWYVLVALVAYAAVATTGWRVAASALRDARVEAAAQAVPAPEGAGGPGALPVDADGSRAAPRAPGESGLWYPIPGARVPADDAHLPGAERAYRSGIAQGFSFWSDTAGVPITYGTPVIAAGSGTVVRADSAYVELSRTEWEDLLARVAEGADERQLDALRGRQVWVELDDGRILRYGHLASVRSGLSVGQRVTRGRVIGTVGNSGTGDAVAGRTGNARLHFEIWDGDRFVGQGLEPDEIRMAAASLFTGP